MWTSVFLIFIATICTSRVSASLCDDISNPCGIRVGNQTMLKDDSFTSEGDLDQGNHGVHGVFFDMPHYGFDVGAELVFEGNIWCNWMIDEFYTPDSLRIQFVGKNDNRQIVAMEIKINQTMSSLNTRYENNDHTWTPYTYQTWPYSNIDWFTYDEFTFLNATAKNVTAIKIVREEFVLNLTVVNEVNSLIIPLAETTQLDDVWRIQTLCARKEVSDLFIKNIPGVDLPAPTTTPRPTEGVDPTLPPGFTTVPPGFTTDDEGTYTETTTDFTGTTDLIVAATGPPIFPIFLGAGGAIAAAAGAAGIAFLAMGGGEEEETYVEEEPSEVLDSAASELDMTIQNESVDKSLEDLDLAMPNLMNASGGSDEAGGNYIDVDPDNSFWMSQ